MARIHANWCLARAITATSRSHAVDDSGEYRRPESLSANRIPNCCFLGQTTIAVLFDFPRPPPKPDFPLGVFTLLTRSYLRVARIGKTATHRRFETPPNRT